MPEPHTHQPAARRLYYLLFIEPLGELLLALLIWGGLRALRRPLALPWALALGVALVGGGKLAIFWSRGQAAPLLLLTVSVTVACVASIALWPRPRPRVRAGLALGAVVALLVLAHLSFTSVETTRSYPMTWRSGTPLMGDPSAGRPAQRHVVLRHADNPGYHVAFYSDRLYALLSARRPDATVPMTMSLIYHWGDFAGYSVDRVAGEAVTSEEQGYGGVRFSGNQRPPSPYPARHLGWRWLPKVFSRR